MTNISNLSIKYNPLFPPQPPNNTPAKFSWFGRFPPEVQAIIFEFAAANDEPRFLELFTKTREAEQQRDLKIRHQVPALLHVSREARRWAKKYYIKLMGTSRCYLDPRKDVVFMQIQLFQRCTIRGFNIKRRTVNLTVWRWRNRFDTSWLAEKLNIHR